MKKIFLFSFLFLLFVLNSFCQEIFTVVRVQGSVKSNGKILQTGNKIDAKSKIVYEKNSDILYVMSSARGRLILSGNKAKKNTNGELYAILQDELTPAHARLSTRQGLPTNDIELIKFFSCDDEISQGRFFIIDEGSYPLPSQVFPQNPKAYFYARYEYQGEKINKKFMYEGESLLISKDELYKIDGKKIALEQVQNLQICYFYKDPNDGKEKSKYFVPFQPVFVSGETLKSETDVLMKNLKQIHAKDANKNEMIFDEIYTYFNEIYGKPTNSNLAKWLKKTYNFEVNKK